MPGRSSPVPQCGQLEAGYSASYYIQCGDILSGNQVRFAPIRPSSSHYHLEFHTIDAKPCYDCSNLVRQMAMLVLCSLLLWMRIHAEFSRWLVLYIDMRVSVQGESGWGQDHSSYSMILTKFKKCLLKWCATYQSSSKGSWKTEFSISLLKNLVQYLETWIVKNLVSSYKANPSCPSLSALSLPNQPKLTTW